MALNWHEFSSAIALSSEPANVASFTGGRGIIRILDVILDKHVEVAKYLFLDASKLTGIERDRKIRSATDSLERAYVALEKTTRGLFGSLRSRADDVCQTSLVLAAIYISMGDKAAARMRLAKAKHMFDLHLENLKFSSHFAGEGYFVIVDGMNQEAAEARLWFDRAVKGLQLDD